MSPPISGVIPSLNGRGNLTGDHFIDIEALVDTGATYTTTPGSMLVRLGIEPEGVRRFELVKTEFRLTYGGYRQGSVIRPSASYRVGGGFRAWFALG